MNLLTNALRAETLDASLTPIMRALGIKTGDTAGNIFSGLGDDEWLDLSLEARRDWLLRWLSFELIDSIAEVMDEPTEDTENMAAEAADKAQRRKP